MSTQKKVEILKAKLRNDLFITADYSETIGGELRNLNAVCNAPAHDDLRKAFRVLTGHLALISQQVKINDKKGRKVDTSEKANAREALIDPDNLFKFTDEDWIIVTKMECTGFSIGGSGDSEGVSLQGNRTLSNDKILNLSAPFTKYHESNGTNYSYSQELVEAIETCKTEVYEYLFGGKHAPDTQMSLEFPISGDDGEGEPNKKPKRTGKGAAVADDF